LDFSGALHAPRPKTTTLEGIQATWNPGLALVLWFGAIRGGLRVVVMVENLADSPACALGDFASPLGCAYADVLAGDDPAFADIASGFDWMKGDKVACAFPNTLGCCSSTLGGPLADVSGTLAHVATGTALMGLLFGGGLRCVGRLRWLGLAVLTLGDLAIDGRCEHQERDR
jgi:hypothetical protein